MADAAVSAIRVSVLAPVGRVDLTLPTGVSVAEVNAELASRLNLEPDLALGTVLGEPLSPRDTVGAQITDGSVLQLSDVRMVADLVVHDDLGDAIRSVHGSEEHQRALVGRVASLVACAVALVLGLLAMLAGPPSSLALVGSATIAVALLGLAIWCSTASPDLAAVLVWGAGGYAAAAAHVASGPHIPLLVPGVVVLVAACAFVGVERGRGAAVSLGVVALSVSPTLLVEPVETTVTLLLLVAGFAPMLIPQLALLSARMDSWSDRASVEASVERGHVSVLSGIVSLGTVLLLLVPGAMATGRAEALLAIDVALGFLLFSRSLPRWRMVATTLALGASALLVGALATVATHETWRPLILAAALLVAAALALCRFGPGRLGFRLGLLADGAESLTRFLLLPLGVWALGLLSSAPDWIPG